MIPVKVRLEGFMSYREAQTLDFRGASLWLLSGENGSGKSAVFDAITYVLFNQVRGISKNLSDLINHHQDEMKVVLDFRLGERLFRAFRSLDREKSASRQILALTDCDDTNGIPVQATEKEEGFRGWIRDHIQQDYLAFTTSVLLQQGYSDRLIIAEPAERYRILSNLIDLSRYQRLKDLAEDRERTARVRVEIARREMKNLAAVSEEELRQAAQYKAIAEENMQTAVEAKASADERRSHAIRWEFLSGEWNRLRMEQDEDLALMERSAEIESGVQRFNALNQVLPTLERIQTARSRLERNQQTIQKAHARADLLKHRMQDLEQQAAKCSATQVGIQNEVAALAETANEHLRQISGLTPIARTVEHLARDRAALEILRREFDTFPSDLESQLERYEQAWQAAQQAKNAIAWLQVVYDERKNLQVNDRSQLEAKEKRVELQKQSNRLHLLLEEASEQRAHADQDVEQAALRLHTAEIYLQTAEQAEARFNAISEKLVCDYCGQPLTAAHVAEERARVALDRKEKRRVYAEAQAAQAYAAENRQAAEVNYGRVQRELQACEAQLANVLQQIGTLEQEARNISQRLQNAYGNLEPLYAQRIGVTLTPQAEDWRSTVYPTSSDLQAVRELADQAALLAQELNRSREKVHERARKQTLLQERESAITNRERDLPAGSNAAVKMLQAENRRYEATGKELREKRSLAESLGRQLGDLKSQHFQISNEWNVLQREVFETQAANEELGIVIQAELKQVPRAWHKIVETDLLQLQETLLAEMETVRSYMLLSRQLETALERQAQRESQLNELEMKMGQVHQDGRIAVDLAERLVHKAAKVLESAKDDANRAIRDYEELYDRKLRWEQVESALKADDVLFLQYGLLTAALGEQGIQKQLLRAAEREIVGVANEILEGLSGGRCQMELRPVDNSKKALDLVVRDLGTGGRPTPITFASGSQRFRVAISLALSIGKYMRKDASRIEAVIIDEGFGALDQAGREDMIHELSRLRSQLERIILVSHQDEFAARFSNGYRIVLQNGASIVQA